MRWQADSVPAPKAWRSRLIRKRSSILPEVSKAELPEEIFTLALQRLALLPGERHAPGAWWAVFRYGSGRPVQHALLYGETWLGMKTGRKPNVGLIQRLSVVAAKAVTGYLDIPAAAVWRAVAFQERSQFLFGVKPSLHVAAIHIAFQCIDEIENPGHVRTGARKRGAYAEVPGTCMNFL